VADQPAGLFLEHAVPAAAVGVAETQRVSRHRSGRVASRWLGVMEATRCADLAGGLAGMAQSVRLADAGLELHRSGERR
jgi:hypothetical protein